MVQLNGFILDLKNPDDRKVYIRALLRGLSNKQMTDEQKEEMRIKMMILNDVLMKRMND